MHPNLSLNLSYTEFIYSATAKLYGIDNTPSDEIIANGKVVAEQCFEPIREWVGNKIYVSSFYRCVELNTKVKGDDHSNHLKGYAIDMDFNVYGGKTNKEVFDWCVEQYKAGKLDFDELLWEGGYNGWIHIAYLSKEKNRHHIGQIPNPK